jgi:outer membrane receptor for monomeric catechols
MKDGALKADFSYYPTPEHTVKFGYNAVLHNLQPGIVKSSGGTSSFEDFILPDVNAFEHALYVSDDYKVNDNLSVKGGLRLTGFSSIGSGTVYNFDENYEVIDSTVYKSGQVIKTYYRLSPRLGAAYQLDGQSSVKANYTRTYQFMQMASNSTAGSTLDLWFTAGKNIQPQSCDQYAVGYFRNFLNNSLEASAELFYKKMNNTIDFKDYANLLLNRKLEGELRFGNSEQSFLVGYNRFNDNQPMFGWIEYNGQSLL